MEPSEPLNEGAQHVASFIAHTQASTRAALPRFVKDEFDAFLECGILAHGFLIFSAPPSR